MIHPHPGNSELVGEIEIQNPTQNGGNRRNP